MWIKKLRWLNEKQFNAQEMCFRLQNSMEENSFRDNKNLWNFKTQKYKYIKKNL